MKMILAQFLTLSLSLSLSLWEKIGMIFSLVLHLYLIENWKSSLTLTVLVFTRHIACAFLIKNKYRIAGYTTGFT